MLIRLILAILVSFSILIPMVDHWPNSAGPVHPVLLFRLCFLTVYFSV